MKPRRSPRGEVPGARAASGLRLGVSGIRLTGSHGALPEERERGNRFEIDVELECTTFDVVETDELAGTIDYREITEIVREINRRRPFTLIESFAGAIAGAVLMEFPTVSEVLVRVSKMSPPGLSEVDRTVAEVTRSRR